LKNTKLIQLLETFSQSEFNEFGKFINSPFYNESEKMITFYEYLKNYFPEFRDDNFTKENLYKKIYGGADYEDKKIRDRFSDMLKLAEEYISVCNFRNTLCFEKLHTLYEYRERGLEIHFEKKYREIKLRLEKEKIRDSDVYYADYSAANARSDFYENKKLIGKRKHAYKDLEYETDSFLKYSISIMLTNYCAMNNWEPNSNYKFGFNFYPEVMNYLEKNKIRNEPLINCFHLILKLREDKENDKNFFKLKNLYVRHSENLNLKDKVMVSTTLFNEALTRFLQERKNFENEHFNMLKLQLEDNSYPVENGYMSREQFWNYAIIPVHLGQIEWAEKAVSELTEKIVPAVRASASAYARALLYFAGKKYDDAVKEIAVIKGGDYFYYLKVKTLLSQIYYEQSEFDELFSLLDSFKRYIAENEVMHEVVRFRYSNYTSALFRLAHVSLKYDEYKLLKLIEKIKNFSYYDITTNKTWLLKKAYDLQNKKH